MKLIHCLFIVFVIAVFFGGLVLASPVPSPETALAQTGDPVLIAAGDIANCGRTQDEATAQLLDAIPGTVVTLGDNAYPDGTLTQISDCYGPTWGRHKDRTFPVPGNHDYHTPGAAGYYTYFGAAASPLDSNCTSDCKGYYSYDLGAWHIIALNSEITHTVGSAQEQWLRSDLAANRSVCTLAYWHRPRFSSGQHGNTFNVQPFWQALYDYGADVVLNGHDHAYERFAPQNPSAQAEQSRGIREFVVGTGGAGLYSFPTIQPNSEARNNTTWGVLKLTLHATSYDWEFNPIAGQTFTDAGSANCVSTEPVPTDTPTNTLTLTPTLTVTPMDTLTMTPTLTVTPTDTPTDTPTLTPTLTVTPTGTPIMTPTLTVTPTDTPTITPTATLTPTQTPTLTPTLTPTPTDTPTITPTPTDTPTSTPTNTPPSSDLIFADSFESGNLSAWSSSTTDGGDLSVSGAAALVGSNGLQAVIDDNTSIYVTDDQPSGERHYRARFYFDPNSISMASSDNHYIFYGYSGTSTLVLRVQFRFRKGNYQLMAALRNDSSGWTNTGWFTIGDAPHAIELDWQGATEAGSSNGGLTLWIDGVRQANLTGVDNDTRRIDRVRLGAVAALDTGTRGTYYFDAFESWR